MSSGMTSTHQGNFRRLIMSREEQVFAETEISEWEYGQEYEHKVFRMSLAEMRSLEEEYFTPEMTDAWDKLYYSLLDHKKLREKFVKEKLEKDHKNNLIEVNDE